MDDKMKWLAIICHLISLLIIVGVLLGLSGMRVHTYVTFVYFLLLVLLVAYFHTRSFFTSATVLFAAILIYTVILFLITSKIDLIAAMVVSVFGFIISIKHINDEEIEPQPIAKIMPIEDDEIVVEQIKPTIDKTSQTRQIIEKIEQESAKKPKPKKKIKKKSRK